MDDHPAPLVELRRLMTLQRAYNFMNEGDLAVERKDAEGALKAYSAAEALVPGKVEMVFWHAISLVGMGRVEEAIPLRQRTYKADPRWWELVRRLPKAGLLPDDPKLMARLVSAAPAKH